MKNIVSLLEQSLNRSGPLYDDIAKSFLAEAGAKLNRSIDFEFTDRIRRAVQGHPSFSGRINSMLCGGGGSVSLTFAVPTLLQRWTKSEGAKNALDRLGKLLDFKTAECTLILAITGIKVSKSVELFDRVHLSPFEDLSDSPHKQMLANRHIALMDLGMFKPPSAVLTGRVTIEPFIHSMSEKPAFTSMDMLPLIEKVRLCLALIGPCSTRPVSGWWQYEDAFLVQSLGAPSGSAYLYEPVFESYSEEDSPECPTEEAKQLLTEYRSLEGETLEKVDLAINRLNKAIKAKNPGDAAIEIAIALECLLSDGGNSELLWKVAMRSAFLNGGDVDALCSHAKTIKQVYKIRSSVMHTGHTPKDPKNETPFVIKTGERLCAATIRAVIRRKTLPSPESWALFDLSSGKLG